MSPMAKANLILSSVNGLLIASVAGALGSKVWWLYGLLGFCGSVVGLSAAQMAGDIDSG